jgi:hypothetical protein
MGLWFLRVQDRPILIVASDKCYCTENRFNGFFCHFRDGYPDSGFLDRVLDELYAKGVTKESSKIPKEYTEFSRFQN